MSSTAGGGARNAPLTAAKLRKKEAPMRSTALPAELAARMMQCVSCPRKSPVYDLPQQRKAKMHTPVDETALTESLARRHGHLPDEIRARTVFHIASLYDETKHLLADSGFDNELLNGDKAKFQQRYWEMLLARHLRQIGARITHERSGPDFGFEMDGRKIWIEAVAPNRSSDIDDYYRAEMLN